MGDIWSDTNYLETWLGGQTVIHDLFLKLKIEDSTAILGPNKAGKCTILNRSLYPIVKPDSHLAIFGTSIINIWELRSSIGIVNSDLETRFRPSILARELIQSAFFGSTRLGRDQNPSLDQIAKSDMLLKQLNLEAFAEKPYGQLSDGQRRRLMIARALVRNPKVLVLDEPCMAFDLKACHQLLDTMREL